MLCLARQTRHASVTCAWQARRAARSDAAGFARVHSLCAFATFNPQSRQIPLSRFLTSRRTYHGLLRIFLQQSPVDQRILHLSGRMVAPRS
jgi:hypothetical protein